MGQVTTRSLSEVIGARIRAWREASQVRQEVIAATARRWGLRWTRATVAALETGGRRLRPEELLLLPYVVSLSQPQDEEETFIELADFLPDDEWVMLTPEARVHSQAVREILRGRAAGTWPSPWIEVPASQIRAAMLRAFRRAAPKVERVWRHVWPEVERSLQLVSEVENDAAGDAEQKAARKLGVPPLAIALAARKLWGRSLAEERDRRVSEQWRDEITLRPLQAIRGHVTRALLGELGPIVAGLKGSRTSSSRTGRVPRDRSSRRVHRRPRD